MAIIVKPVTLVNGAVAQATDVESDFNTIYNDYNGNITNANLSPTAAIADTKLNQITTGGKVSGAALISLASITSGAGIIPVANMATGTSATQLIALDSNAKLPAVDGSQLTNIATGFVDRGDVATSDLSMASITTDGAYHDWDLSSIISSGAKAVVINTLIRDDTSGSSIAFRKKGNSNDINISRIFTPQANVYASCTLTVPVSTNRVIEYKTDNTAFTNIELTVVGYW